MLAELEAAQGMLKYLNHHIKAELEGLDETGLNWVPEGVEATNSIYGLALHIAYSQVAFANALDGIKRRLSGLDKLKESAGVSDVFKMRGTSVESAKALLKEAAGIVNEVFSSLTSEQLEVPATLPGGGSGTGHSWVQLLIMHTGEHVGHMSLTRQLYNQSLTR